MENTQSAEPIVTDLENLEAGIDYHDYWRVLPYFIGSEYRDIANQNQVKLDRLRAIIDSKGTTTNGEHTLPKAEAARQWYLKLGTHNTLYGARDDLQRAAAYIFFEGSDEPEITPAQLAKTINDPESLNKVSVANRLMVAQMLIDGSRDPSPMKNGSNLDAYNNGMALLAAKTSKSVLLGLKEAATRRELSEKEKWQLSDALKFNGEANFIVIEATGDDTWTAHYNRLLNDAIGGDEKAKHKLKVIENAHEYKQHAYISEILRQTRALIELEPNLTNGMLTEHYFNLLLRQTMFSYADKIVPVEVATGRQDSPRDDLIFKVPITSFDAAIRDLPNFEGRSLFVQLKTGDAIAGKLNDQQFERKKGNKKREYHKDILKINIFRNHFEDEKLGAYNYAIRQETITGLMELSEAITELLSGHYGDGSFTTIEKHMGVIRRAIKAKLVGEVAMSSVSKLS